MRVSLFTVLRWTEQTYSKCTLSIDHSKKMWHIPRRSLSKESVLAASVPLLFGASDVCAKLCGLDRQPIGSPRLPSFLVCFPTLT